MKYSFIFMKISMKTLLKKPSITRAAVCLFLILATSRNAQAQVNTIYANLKAVELRHDAYVWLQAEQASGGGIKQVLLTYAPGATFPKNGITVLDYSGNNTCIALINTAVTRDMNGITGIASVTPAMKIASAVREVVSGKSAESIISIGTVPGVSKQTVSEFIGSIGGRLEESNLENMGIFLVSIPAGSMEKLASPYWIKFLGMATENAPLDREACGGQASERVTMPTALGGKGLEGTNVVIGVGDQSSGIYHIDQADRVINYNPASSADHGVFVNGITGGDGILDQAGKGVATNATLVNHLFDALLGVHREMRDGHNMTITNNSYAVIVGNCSYAGVYDNYSVATDKLAIESPDVVNVFAVGNDGRLGCNGYPAGYGNVCGGFQTGKNIITVGATYLDYRIGEGSARGPIRDGRLKPEMSAFGIDILSCIPPASYKVWRGTSFACPQVAGALGLITERYRQLHGPLNPRADLLKAIILNGTMDLGNPGPDFLYGFGFLNVDRALNILEKNQYATNSVTTGGSQTITITVPANTAQLKVMLCYNDLPANPLLSKQLINDIDLTVAEPGGTVHYPLVLDPSIAGVDKNATEKADHLNNSEQVTINNPPAGTYTITVKAFDLPSGKQEYALAYDFVATGMKLLFPVTNTSAPADTTMNIYWEASPDTSNSFTLEYSSDNGTSWNSIANNIPPAIRYYKWKVPALNTDRCVVKITRNGYSSTSGSFIINQRPTLSLSADQCPGSIAVDWTAVPGVSKYYLLLKKGAHLEVADSVLPGTTHYDFNALNVNNTYYVSAQPVFNGKPGYRSLTLTRIPSDGNCNAVAHGDLAIDSLVTNNTGRTGTSTELTIHEPLIATIRNLDNQDVADYSIVYQVDGGSWVTHPGLSIPAKGTARPIIDYVNFSNVGSYTVKMAVHNNSAPDPVAANDTLTCTIRQLPNEPVVLLTPLYCDFDTEPNLELRKDSAGFTTDYRWDFFTSNDTGRLRTVIPGSKNVKTRGSMSMDVLMNTKGNVNFLTGTFNLNAYDTSADEIRFEFEYEMRGMPVLKDSNKVWVRGNDKWPWIPVFTYANITDTGKLNRSGTISLKDVFSSNGQNFTKSAQIRFGQYDSTLIVDDFYGGGVTIDQVRVYKVTKDIALSQIIAPITSNCGSTTLPVIVKIKNGTITPMNGISVSYQLDNGPIVTELLPITLGGKDSFNYQFTKNLSGLNYATHSLNVWANVPGEDYVYNDSILNYSFYIKPLIDTFPYLEDFEASAGNWHGAGTKSSWAYGVPSALKIKTAASGQKAWKTNLFGNYNPNEKSYLYSPCFNTSEMNSPMLSFSMATDIENCGQELCDGAWLEYSVDDGKTWAKLGASGKGTNWYTDATYQVWNGIEDNRWHVASYSLPKNIQLNLRFVLSADIGAGFEGLAIDDIHIFDLANEIFNDDTQMPLTLTEIINAADKQTDFIKNSSIVTTLISNNQSLGNTDANLYRQNSITDLAAAQYIMPRSYMIRPTYQPTGNVTLRLFLTEAEARTVFTDTTCKTCLVPDDVYRLGITRYKDNNNHTEDGSLANNAFGLYDYKPYSEVRWVPYDNGYYAEFQTDYLGEFWFNDGGPAHSLPINKPLIEFTATKMDEQHALLRWSSILDAQMKYYTVQRSLNADSTYKDLVIVNSVNNSGNKYEYIDTPALNIGDTIHYRILCSMANSKQFHSAVRSIRWTKGNLLLHLYPNPTTNGRIQVDWSAYPGSTTSIEITDMTGRTAFSTQFQTNDWNNTTTLQLGSWSKGLYIFKINIDGQSFVEKINVR